MGQGDSIAKKYDLKQALSDLFGLGNILVSGLKKINVEPTCNRVQCCKNIQNEKHFHLI